MELIDHVRLIVINPDSTPPYSGMLPGYLAGQYSLNDLFIDIAALCKQAGAHLIRGSLERVDAETCGPLMIAAPSAIARKVIRQ